MPTIVSPTRKHIFVLLCTNEQEKSDGRLIRRRSASAVKGTVFRSSHLNKIDNRENGSIVIEPTPSRPAATTADC